MDRFEENMFAFAFDHLNGDEKQARSFMLKNDKLHRQWLQNFFDNYLNQFSLCRCIFIRTCAFLFGQFGILVFIKLFVLNYFAS